MVSSISERILSTNKRKNFAADEDLKESKQERLRKRKLRLNEGMEHTSFYKRKKEEKLVKTTTTSTRSQSIPPGRTSLIRRNGRNFEQETKKVSQDEKRKRRYDVRSEAIRLTSRWKIRDADGEVDRNR